MPPQQRWGRSPPPLSSSQWAPARCSRPGSAAQCPARRQRRASHTAPRPARRRPPPPPPGCMAGVEGGRVQRVGLWRGTAACRGRGLEPGSPGGEHAARGMLCGTLPAPLPRPPPPRAGAPPARHLRRAAAIHDAVVSHQVARHAQRVVQAALGLLNHLRGGVRGGGGWGEGSRGSQLSG